MEQQTSPAARDRAARMSRSSAHRLRRKLAGTPFDQAWDRALAVHAHLMADPFAQPGRGAPPQQPWGEPTWEGHWPAANPSPGCGALVAPLVPGWRAPVAQL